MNYFVIGDQDTVLGFSLAGVDGVAVTCQEETNNAFTEAISKENIAIIVITEKCASWIRERLEHYLFTKDFPLIVEIPDRSGSDPHRPSLKQMINAAIGIKI